MMPRRCVRLAPCVIALAIAAPAAAQQTAAQQTAAPLAVPADGEPFAARLAAVDPQWQVTFQTEKGDRTLPAAGLAWWGHCADLGRGPVVVLADGGLLAADVPAADAQQVAVDSALFGTLKLPRALVSGVVFQPPAERLGRDRLIDRLAQASGQSDRAILTNGDELVGTMESIQEGKLRFHSGTGPIELQTRRVAAVLCHPALRPSPEKKPDVKGLAAFAGFRDGSRLRATELIVSGESLKLTGLGGLSLSGPAKELVFFQPLGAQVAYLSDLSPESYRHVPFLSLSWPYRVDRSVSGGMLRSAGRVYLKGLGMHSASRLTYVLAEPYRRFQAELAVDDETEGGGSVGFRVFVDGQVKYTSPAVRGGQSPLPVSVDIAGAKRLDLVVDFAERADELDHADWLNARLIR